MDKEIYRYWLANIPNIGPRKIDRLLQVFGEAEQVFCASRSDIEKVMYENHEENRRENRRENSRENHEGDRCRFDRKDISAFIQSKDLEKIQINYAKLKNSGIYFVSKEDIRYPSRLKSIYAAPYALYVKGNLPIESNKILAVVGARECSTYGKEMARYFAGEIAAQGVGVISGLARGIDAFAHEGALASGGSTYGVLGCGIDICYPKENINLYMDMQSKGGILSEYPPGTQPFSSNFPMRNRIISGLCDGILVIEAKEKSGSLITVDMGLDQGKDIYALPARATDIFSLGCNNLIKMGAKLVTTPKDVLEDLCPNYEQNTNKDEKKYKLLETESKIVYSCLSLEPKHIEEIAKQSNLPFGTLMEHLLILEFHGIVRQTRKNYYIAMK